MADDNMFTSDEIKVRIHEKPFVPLRIVTSSGKTYDVAHPNLVLFGRRSLMVGTASNENPTQYETVSRVAVMHITDLQDLPHAKPASGNGAP